MVADVSPNHARAAIEEHAIEHRSAHWRIMRVLVYLYRSTTTGATGRTGCVILVAATVACGLVLYVMTNDHAATASPTTVLQNTVVVGVVLQEEEVRSSELCRLRPDKITILKRTAACVAFSESIDRACEVEQIVVGHAVDAAVDVHHPVLPGCEGEVHVVHPKVR